MGDTVASIGTTHPWNIAGLGLDLQVAGFYGVRALSVVAAVSAQDARGLHALEAVSPEMLRAQLDALPIREVDALRIGALPNAEHVRIVAAFVRANAKVPAVVDPVFGATLGGSFLDSQGINALRDELASAPSVILTPNLDEAAVLLESEPIVRETMAAAAGALRERGARAVVLKGGHLGGDPMDILVSSRGVTLYDTDQRLPKSVRGTGCILAMALACELARGLALRDAVQSARTYVRGRIAASLPFAGVDVAY